MHEITAEDKTEEKLKAECTKVGDHLYLRGGTKLGLRDLPDKDTQIVFSMGGKGTRLKHITNDKYSKHLIEVNGKPLSKYVIDMWLENGFRNFCFLVDDTHRGKSVQNYYGDGKTISSNIIYSVEHSPLGSGGAIKYAKDNNAIKGSYINHYPDDVIVNYPKFAEDFAKVFLSAVKLGYLCVVLCVPGKTYPYGVVLDKDGTVADFIEKPFIEKDTNTGIYGMSERAFYLFDEIESGKEFKIERTVLGSIARMGKMLKVLLPTEHWVPVNDEPNLNKFKDIMTC